MAYVPKFDRILKPDGDEFRAMPRGTFAGAPPAGAATGGGPAPAAPVAGNPQASSAGGFVSFDQRLNANQSGANAMAGKVASDVRKGADAARSGLNTAQRSFNDKLRAGSLAGPDAPANGNSPVASTTLAAAQGGQAAPPAGQPSAAPSPAPQPVAAKPMGDTFTAQPAAPASSYLARTGAGLKTGAAPFAREAATSLKASATPVAQQAVATPVDGFSRRAAVTVPGTGASLKSQATGLAKTPLDTLQPTGNDWDRSKFQYSGPNDLRSEPGWSGLESQTRDAEDALGATRDNAGLQGLVDRNYAGSRTAGGSSLDAALTGAAGGQRFAELRGKYGGLSKMLGEADTAAKGRADAARTSSADAAAAYGKRAEATDAANKAAADAAAKVGADRQADLAHQAELPSIQGQEAMEDGRGVTEQTSTIGEERQSQFDGLWEEWLKAGKPPYEEWKAKRKAGG